MRKIMLAACILAGPALLQGCAAIAVADTAISATATIVGATVDVGGAIVGAAADAVRPSKEEKPDCSKDENKDAEACKKPAEPKE
jgi:starvation-inducible outer membrane lipoprotein